MRHHVANLGLPVLGNGFRGEAEAMREEQRLEGALIRPPHVAQRAGKMQSHEHRGRAASIYPGSQWRIPVIKVEPVERNGNEVIVAVRSAVLHLEACVLRAGLILSEDRLWLRELDGD